MTTFPYAQEKVDKASPKRFIQLSKKAVKEETKILLKAAVIKKAEIMRQAAIPDTTVALQSEAKKPARKIIPRTPKQRMMDDLILLASTIPVWFYGILSIFSPKYSRKTRDAFAATIRLYRKNQRKP